MAFMSLASLTDIDWLREPYRRTRKDEAVGGDGMTAAEYEQVSEGNLQRLLDRAISGAYRAAPERRVHIPKGTWNETRPIETPPLTRFCPIRDTPSQRVPCRHANHSPANS